MKKAFTLAEILVTLMIIGVIAAMTIPTLNQNTKNNEYVAGCLKAYSTLSGAVNRMKVDFGPIGLGSKWNNEAEFWKEFTKQLNTVKICTNGQKGCFVNETVKQLNNTNHANYDGSGYNVRTTDGMAYNFQKTLCTSDKGVSTTRISNGMGRFIVDVNGDKGPNTFGKDLFFFCLVKGEGIIPAGIDNKSANCTKSGTGIDCAAKVVNEKKIDYK